MLWIAVLLGALGALFVLGVLGWTLFGIWFVVWVVLLVSAVAFLGSIGWTVLRKVLTLGGEVARASELLSQARQQIQRLNTGTDRPLAVFADPHQLRREQQRAARRRRTRRTMRASRAGG